MYQAPYRYKDKGFCIFYHVKKDLLHERLVVIGKKISRINVQPTGALRPIRTPRMA